MCVCVQEMIFIESRLSEDFEILHFFFSSTSYAVHFLRSQYVCGQNLFLFYFLFNS